MWPQIGATTAPARRSVVRESHKRGLAAETVSLDRTPCEASWGLGLHTVCERVAALGLLALGNLSKGGAVVRISLPRRDGAGRGPPRC